MAPSVSWDETSIVDLPLAREAKMASASGSTLSGWARSFNVRVGASCPSKMDCDMPLRKKERAIITSEGKGNAFDDANPVDTKSLASFSFDASSFDRVDAIDSAGYTTEEENAPLGSSQPCIRGGRGKRRPDRF